LDPSLLVSSGTAIAHCPLSNAYFSAKPFPLREALVSGVKVGLGTDIAGGYSADTMSAMRQAVAVSRMREGAARIEAERKESRDTDDESQSLGIDWREALYLATRGGAVAMNIPRVLGMFKIGAAFDAQCRK
jgi:guanine deaminase